MHDVNKKSVMVYLDPKIVAKAREIGLNISKICENALREAIRRLKSENCGINETYEKFLLRPGFEPGSRAREARILDRTILPELPAR